MVALMKAYAIQVATSGLIGTDIASTGRFGGSPKSRQKQ
jgi:hypothetical protein